MDLTIHIGPHKTGTTALQLAFAKGSRVLKKAGVLYPRTNWLHPAQHRLAFAMKAQRINGTREKPDRDVEVRKLLDALQRTRSKQAIISSEEFFACDADSIGWLKRQLLECRVKILTFLRRPDEFLVSCYGQKMRQPGNGFDAPIRRFVRAPRQIAPEIDYARCLAPWADAFGESNVDVYCYETSAPLPCTLSHLGLPSDFLPDNILVNRSPPGAVTETMRHAKTIKLASENQRQVFTLAARVFAEDPPFYLSDADRLSIIREFEADNDRLFQRFGQQNPYTVDRFTPSAATRDFNLCHADMMRLIERLL